MNTRIPLLMTGATGLVGSRFVELFGDQYEIFNLDLTTGVDITNLDSVEQFVLAHPAKTLIHLAAFTNTAEAFKQQGDQTGLCYQVNVVGTRNIATVCAKHQIHLIHISTDFVFDGTKKTPYVETDPRSPIEWYGQTKAEAEAVVESLLPSATIVRIAYPYRAHYELKPDIVQKIRAGLVAGTLYPQFDDTTITPTFIDDIAVGFHNFVSRPQSGIFHLVGSSSHSPYELARHVATAYGFDPAVVKAGSLTAYLASNPRPFARYAAISNAKYQATYQHRPQTLPEGLSAMMKE